MTQITIILVFIILPTLSFGQNSRDDYSYYTERADSLYKAKDFKNAASTYSEAFKSLGWKRFSIHRYNAACSWTLAGVADSAFFNLITLQQKQIILIMHVYPLTPTSKCCIRINDGSHYLKL